MKKLMFMLILLSILNLSSLFLNQMTEQLMKSFNRMELLPFPESEVSYEKIIRFENKAGGQVIIYRKKLQEEPLTFLAIAQEWIVWVMIFILA